MVLLWPKLTLLLYLLYIRKKSNIHKTYNISSVFLVSKFIWYINKYSSTHAKTLKKVFGIIQAYIEHVSRK